MEQTYNNYRHVTIYDYGKNIGKNKNLQIDLELYDDILLKDVKQKFIDYLKVNNNTNIIPDIQNIKLCFAGNYLNEDDKGIFDCIWYNNDISVIAYYK